jgi:hypothetical protein
MEKIKKELGLWMVEAKVKGLMGLVKVRMSPQE